MKKFILTGGLVVLVIIAIILVGEVINDYRNRKWDGVNRFTLVVLDIKNHSAQILSIDPETKQPVKLVLPSDMEINTVLGKGVWKIGSVVALALKNGSTWAADSITNFLEIPYTAVRDRLGIWDKIAWWNLSRNVNWQEINLSGTTLVSETTAPDGVKALSLTSWWKDKAGDIFYSSNLAKEELRVEVYNTTAVTGLALKAAQILDNTGVKVVVVDQSDQKTDKCIINSVSETENDQGILWIRKYFNCDWKGTPGMDSKQVKVYLGSNYARWMNGRQSN